MKSAFLLLGAVAVLASCATDDEYYYGYARAYRTLPGGFEKVDVGGAPYWHHGGRFYRYDEQRGYLLVRPPRGSEQVVATSSGGTSPAPSGAAMESAADGGSGGLFNPGVLKERGPARTVGRSPLRRGRLGGGE